MSRIARAAAITAAAGAVMAAGAGVAAADSGADGAAVNSPGVVSGNLVQAPVHLPVNVCGNSINVIGLLNPAFGTECSNGSGDSPLADSGIGDPVVADSGYGADALLAGGLGQE